MEQKEKTVETSEIVADTEALNALIARVRRALKEYATFSQ